MLTWATRPFDFAFAAPFVRPLQFNVTLGQYTHVMRVTKAGMIARHRHAGAVHVDPHGVSTGYDDVFTRLEKARSHYTAVGLRESYVEQFIR